MISTMQPHTSQISSLPSLVVEPECKLKGRVNLEVHCPERLRHRGVLLLYRWIAPSGSIEVARLSPSTSKVTTMELFLREPLALSTFLGLLPGVSWVREKAEVTAPNATPTVQVSLEESLFPEGDRPRRKLLKDALVAATKSQGRSPSGKRVFAQSCKTAR